MRVIDPGHEYEVASYDGGEPATIRFMKREGVGYPGNLGSHSGTNCQELIRTLIDRVGYLNNQIPHESNLRVMWMLRGVLYQLEALAAERHGRTVPELMEDPTVKIETLPTCPHCGHIGCESHADSTEGRS